MSTAPFDGARTATTVSEDGTTLAYHTLGHGPALVIVGGVLWHGSDYLSLARALADDYEVHVMERRARPGSGRQRPHHAIDDECADLVAVAAATGAETVFGHSFGGLVALETARRHDIFAEVFVYDPGIPLRRRFETGWFDGYRRLLDQGDRRGAFAWMTKHSGFAPRTVRGLPLWQVRLVLRCVIRADAWGRMDRLLEANLAEHRLQAALDAPDPSRFSAISAHTVLLGGAKSPAALSSALLPELARAIPRSTVTCLEGLGHFAPRDQPDRLASAILENRTWSRASTQSASVPAGSGRHPECGVETVEEVGKRDHQY
jgi:pimeloyl-ACP methyl ester carboxylesterase